MSQSDVVSHGEPVEALHTSGERLMTPGEMLNELIRGGYIVPAPAGYGQPRMPTAYRPVPNVTSAHSIPAPMHAKAT